MQTLSMESLWPQNAPEGDQDPRLWGKFYWAALHIAADHAGHDPRKRGAALDMIGSLRDVLPCTQCRRNLRIELGGKPPTDDTDLSEWLQELEGRVALRVAKQDGGGIPATVRRPRRVPCEVGDTEMSIAVAYALRSAVGRKDATLSRWYKSFRIFMRSLVELIPPQKHGLVSMMSGSLSHIPDLKYDLRQWLSACIDACGINTRQRIQSMQRAGRPPSATNQSRRRTGQRIRAVGTGGNVRSTGTRPPLSGTSTQARMWRSRHRTL